VRTRALDGDEPTYRLRGWGRVGLLALVLIVFWPAIALGLWLFTVWRTGVP